MFYRFQPAAYRYAFSLSLLAAWCLTVTSTSQLEQLETSPHDGTLPIITNDFTDKNKYVSTIKYEDLLQMAPFLREPSVWPHHTFALYPLVKEEISESGNPTVSAVMKPFMVIYQGNDSQRSKVTEIELYHCVSVHRYMIDYCNQYIDNDYEECMTLLRDTVSYQLYTVTAYTSTRLDATVEDYTLTRTKVLSWILHTFHSQSYLEIGCADGLNFHGIVREISHPLHAVCVDPLIDSLATYHITSDEYFHTLGNHTTYDVVFIDGLHEANQAYHDFQNSWNRLNPGGTIVFHDTNPATEIQASYPMDPRVKKWNWNGDVWKVRFIC